MQDPPNRHVGQNIQAASDENPFAGDGSIVSDNEDRVNENPYAPPIAAVGDVLPAEEILAEVARIRDYRPGQSHGGLGLSITDQAGDATLLPLGREFPAAPLVLGWTAFTLFGRFSAVFGRLFGGGDVLAFASFVGVAFRIPAQMYVNALVAPSHDRNSRIRGWNWLVVIPGALFFVLALVGSLMGDQL